MQVNENKTTIPDAEAYWISPDGKIFDLKYDQTHIEFICKKPSLFKIHSQYIKKIYSDYIEVYKTEGQASVVIIKILIRKGWIRIRYFDDENIFFIHYDLNNKIASENIKPFIKYIKSDKFKNYKIILLNIGDSAKKYRMDSVERSEIFKEFEGIILGIFNDSEGFYYFDFKEKIQKK